MKSKFCFSLRGESAINFTLIFVWTHFKSSLQICKRTHMLSLNIDYLGSLFRLLSSFLTFIPLKKTQGYNDT